MHLWENSNLKNLATFTKAHRQKPIEVYIIGCTKRVRILHGTAWLHSEVSLLLSFIIMCHGNARLVMDRKLEH